MNDEFKWVCPGRSINESWIHHQYISIRYKRKNGTLSDWGCCERNINSLTKITKWIRYCKIASRIGSGLKSSNLRGEWIQNDLAYAPQIQSKKNDVFKCCYWTKSSWCWSSSRAKSNLKRCHRAIAVLDTKKINIMSHMSHVRTSTPIIKHLSPNDWTKVYADMSSSTVAGTSLLPAAAPSAPWQLRWITKGTKCSDYNYIECTWQYELVDTYMYTNTYFWSPIFASKTWATCKSLMNWFVHRGSL